MTFDSTMVSNILLVIIAIIDLVILTVVYEAIKNKDKNK
jgi:hypothetical protein